MLDPQLAYKLESAVSQVTDEVTQMQSPVNWKRLQEGTLWYELVACILGSGVIYELAKGAARYLKKMGYLSVVEGNFERFETQIVEALSCPIFPPKTSSGLGRKYRYPKRRANLIRKTAEAIYGNGLTIQDILHSEETEKNIRIRLMELTYGIGPKQASLFLRNIGLADDLAILDVHVIRYMKLLHLLPEPFDGATTLAIYEKIEKALLAYSSQINTKLSYLDMAIWVVMRVHQREFAS